MTKRLFSRLAADQRGAVLAEFAVMLLTLIVATFGVIDMGLFLWTDVTLNRATHAAARCGAINSTLCGDAASTATYAASQAWGTTLDASNFVAGACVSGTLTGVQVVGTYTYNFITPGVGPSVNLSQTACFPKQF